MHISVECDISIKSIIYVDYGWIPERPKGADCKSVVNDFEGSNPSPSIARECKIHKDAGVAELADAQDLKSCGTYLPYRFDSGRRHEEKH